MLRYARLLLVVFWWNAAPAQRLPFTVYTTAHGLINNRCHTVRQDALGYIWVGTDHGIARYDGRAFRHYPPPHGGAFRSAPVAIVDAASGCVVFGVSGVGLAYCRGDSVAFVLPASGKIGRPIGLARHPAGDGWLVGDNLHGLAHFSAARRVQKIPLRPRGRTDFACLDVFRDSRGDLWLTTNYGLLFFPRANLAKPQWYEGLPRDIYVSIVREAADRRLYAGCNTGLYKLPPLTAGVRPTAPAERLDAAVHISGVAFSSDGTVWASSGGDGVVQVRPGAAPRRLGLAAGMPAQASWELCADREDNIWIATENGVARLSHPELSVYDFSSYPAAAVKSALVWNDTLLLASNGLTLLAVGAGSAVREVAGYQSAGGYLTERLLRAPDGWLWFTRAFQKKGGDFTQHTFRAQFAGGALRAVQPLDALPGGPNEVIMDKGWAAVGEHLWTIDDRGWLLRYTSGRFYTDSMRAPSGRLIQPTALCAGPDGSVWLLDRGECVARCTLRAGSAVPHLETADYIGANALRAQKFTHLFADSRSCVWLGGEEGLTLLQRLPRGMGHIVVPYGKTEGNTSSNWITSFAEDAAGTVWIGTAGGLDRAVRADLDSVVKPHEDVRIEKGLYRSELCGAYVFFVRRFGDRIAVGSTSCLAVIDVRGSRRPAAAPSIYLSGLTVQGKSRDTLLRSTDVVRFSPDDNAITFSFLGLSFADERAVHYRYKLEGLDEFWSAPTTEASVTYSRIPPGRYTFLVEAQNAGGTWSAQPARFSFRVAAPVWRRWWFITLAVLAVGGAMYGFYRYRLAQVLAIQRIRAKISKDLHDDIGATVSSIGILAGIAGKEGLKDEKRHHYLDTITDQSKYVAETLSDIVWAINPANDSLEQLFARVLRYATELFEARGIDYTIDAPADALSGISLPMEARQHLYLIIKEVVNNLAKYSRAQHASVVLRREAAHLRITIADDGRGFDPSATTGNGLPNMRKRAATLGADLRITSAPGAGTRVALHLPLKTKAPRMM